MNDRFDQVDSVWFNQVFIHTWDPESHPLICAMVSSGVISTIMVNLLIKAGDEYL